MNIEFSVPDSWYDGFYKDKAEPCKAGRSFKILNEKKSDNAVLMIHGYAGYPGEMVSPALALNSSGFDVYVPRLPGMGTSGEDYKNSGKADWLGVSEKAYADLAMQYQNVHVVAHSMGTLIAIILSSKFDVKKMVLAAPAFKLKQKVPKLTLKPLAKSGKVLDIPWKSDPEYKMHYEGAPADDEYLGKEYWSHLYPSQFLDLLYLKDEALKVFPSTKSDLLILAGTDDQLCSFEGALKKRGEGKTEMVTIQGGTHYLYYDKDPQAESKAVMETLTFLLS